jgi:hypothetical protein
LIRPTEEIEMHARTLAIASFLAVALSTGGLVALAQTTKPAEPGTTSDKQDRRDTNRDGVISNQEKGAALDQAEKRFKDADKNNDGGLSRAEARAAKGYGAIEKHFDAMDTNKDGKVTMEERRAWTMANPDKVGKGRTSTAGAAGRSSPASKPSEGGLLPPR